MENRKPRKNVQIFRCKKHSKHQQSPGVCSICLRDRLSKLSTTSYFRRSKYTESSSCSSSSSLSSLESSDHSPWDSPFRLRQRSAVVITKSKSMAYFVPTRLRTRDGESSSETKKNKEKEWFWKKLLIRPRSKRIDEEGIVTTMIQ